MRKLGLGELCGRPRNNAHPFEFLVIYSRKNKWKTSALCTFWAFQTGSLIETLSSNEIWGGISFCELDKNRTCLQAAGRGSLPVPHLQTSSCPQRPFLWGTSAAPMSSLHIVPYSIHTPPSLRGEGKSGEAGSEVYRRKNKKQGTLWQVSHLHLATDLQNQPLTSFKIQFNFFFPFLRGGDICYLLLHNKLSSKFSGLKEQIFIISQFLGVKNRSAS